MSTVAERVAAGAVFLDSASPGWAQRIDLGSLDLSSPCGCVLGQLYYDREQPGHSYPLALNELSMPGSEAEKLGFDAYDDERWTWAKDEYEALAAEWNRVITERRSAS